MSSDTFESIVAGLDITDSVQCEACEKTQATITVQYACGSDGMLLCDDCLNDYGVFLLNKIMQAVLTGQVVAHQCGYVFREPCDIAEHVKPARLDGSPLE